jgi:hypothetical protein
MDYPMWERGHYELHSPPQQLTGYILFEEIPESILIFQSRMGISKFPNDVCISPPRRPWRLQRNARWEKFENKAFGEMNALSAILDDEGDDDKE